MTISSIGVWDASVQRVERRIGLSGASARRDGWFIDCFIAVFMALAGMPIHPRAPSPPCAEQAGSHWRLNPARGVWRENIRILAPQQEAFATKTTKVYEFQVCNLKV